MKLFSPIQQPQHQNRIQVSSTDADGLESLQYGTTLIGFFCLFVEHLFHTPASGSCVSKTNLVQNKVLSMLKLKRPPWKYASKYGIQNNSASQYSNK